MAELTSVARWLWYFNLLFSVQLLLILLLRKPMLRWVGPLPTYRLWLVPLFLLPALGLDQGGLLPTLTPAWLEALPADTHAVVTGSLLPDLVPTSAALSLENLSLTQNASLPWLAVALAAWSFVSLTAALLLIWGIVRFAQRLRTTAQTPGEEVLSQLPIAEVFGRSLPVRLVDELPSPALFGVFSPTLLLPVDFLQRYSPAQQGLILAHEAVHLRRQDNLLNLLLTGLRLILWWNPLIHLAWRRFRLDQELSCDAQALASSNSGQQLYAHALLKTVSEGRMHWSPQPALSTWTGVRELKERTRMIKLNPQHNKRRSLGTLALGSCLLLGAVSTVLGLEMLPAEAPRMAIAPATPAPIRNARIAEPAEPAAVLQVQTPLATLAAEENVTADDEQHDVAETAAPALRVAAAQPQAPRPVLRQQPPAQPAAPRPVTRLPAPDLSAAPRRVTRLPAPDTSAAPQAPSPAEPSPASAPAPAPDAQVRKEVRPISIVRPEYPPRGLQRGVEGYVLVEFTVTATGEVADVRIAEAEPRRIFDKSAIEAASQFRFEPPTQDGEAVVVEGVRYRFNYQLVDDGPWVN